MNIDNKYNSSHNISGEDVLVSVIMPVYNTARYLDRAIGSVLKQNYSNWELICIDDKSEDDSLAILRKYEANPRIKVIANDVNCGQGMARNVGIFHATGKFLCFLDSDDYFSENFLGEMLSICIEHDSDIAICNMRYGIEGSFKWKTRYRNAVCNQSSVADVFSAVSETSPCNKLFKTELIKSNDLKFPEKVFLEDNLFIIKALFFAKKIGFSSKCFYTYWQNSTSTMQSSKNQNQRNYSARVVLNEIFDFARKNNFSQSEFELLKRFVFKTFMHSFVGNMDEDFFNMLPVELRTDDNIRTTSKNLKYKNLFERIFSIKEVDWGCRKVITIFGIKIKKQSR